MKKLQLALLALTVTFATGCPNQPSKELKSEFVDKLNQFLAGEQVRFDCARRGFKYSANYGASPWTYTCHEEQPDPNGPIEAIGIRNDAVEKLVGIVDSNYRVFINNLERKRATTNFVADVVEIGAALAIGVMNGQRALKITGIALNAFRAGRESADLNFYKQQTTPILISKMNDTRAQVYADILRSKGKPANDYGMEAVVKDVVDYYNAGTLITAFQNLREDTAAQAQQSKAEVRKLKGPLTAEATKEFRDLSVAASGARISLERDLFGDDEAKKAVATQRFQQIAVLMEADKDMAAALKNLSVSSKDKAAAINDALIEIRAAASLVNNNALLNKVNQAILDAIALPLPTASASPTPKPSPTPGP